MSFRRVTPVILVKHFNTPCRFIRAGWSCREPDCRRESFTPSDPPSWIHDISSGSHWHAEFKDLRNCRYCNKPMQLDSVRFGMRMHTLGTAAAFLGLTPAKLRKQIAKSDDTGAYLKLYKSEWVCPEYAPLRAKVLAERAKEPQGLLQGEFEQPMQGVDCADKAEYAE